MAREKSIRYSDFKEGKFVEKRNAMTEHPILIFLKKNYKSAYNVPAIAKAVNMNENSVRSMLRKLVKKGVVIHKSPYFAFKR